VGEGRGGRAGERRTRDRAVVLVVPKPAGAPMPIPATAEATAAEVTTIFVLRRTTTPPAYGTFTIRAPG
jgi:hypothetical protein